MKRLLILNRWRMELEERQEKSFATWVLNRPTHVNQHITAGWHAYSSLLELEPGTFRTAFEPFGGIGAQTLMINELFAPSVHEVWELSEQAYRHLLRLPLSLNTIVHKADAYETEVPPRIELAGLDFGDLTVWQTREGQPQRDLLDRVMERKPRGLVLTDIAGPRLHLQRERYETILGRGTCGDYVSYLVAFVRHLEDLYGYRLHRGYYHRWSAVLALRSSSPAEPRRAGALLPTPTQPPGLRMLAS